MRGTHIRHRRGVWAAVLVAVLTAGVAAAVTVGVARMAQDDDATAAPVMTADPGRRAWQVTLDLDTKAGYVVTAGVTDGERQTLTVQKLAFSGKADGVYGGEVTAFPPGTLDESELSGAERLDDGWFLPQFTFAEHAPGAGAQWHTPAVVRKDPSGLWLVAYADTERADGKVGREDLQRLAGAVLAGQPRDLRLPLSLRGALPGGLQLTYVRSPDQKIDRRSAALGLSAPTRKSSAAAVYSRQPEKLDVTVLAGPRDAAWTRTRARLTGETKVAGMAAWYTTGARLVVEAERCVVTIESELWRAELEKLAGQLTIGDCADPDSWIPPLS